MDNGLSYPPVAYIAPQVTYLSSGSGTYTTPTVGSVSPLYLQVIMKGPGGPGSGGGTTPGNGTVSASDTTFGTITAHKGAIANAGTGGAGGTGTSVSPPVVVVLAGQAGDNAASGFTFAPGGFGGGATSHPNQSGTAIVKVNSGDGGPGGDSGSSASPGSGGGEAEWVKAIITTPAATYSYNVGPASVGGAAGTNGGAGLAGAAGFIEITAFFQ